MKYTSQLLIIIILSFSEELHAWAYISEIINKTNQTISFAYPSDVMIQVIGSKSLVNGENLSVSKQRSQISVSPESLTALEKMYIPNGEDDPNGYKRIGITIGTGTGIKPITSNNVDGGYGVFAFIRKRRNWIEKITKDKIKVFADVNFARISEENIVDGSNYILEIDPPDQLKIYPRTIEKINEYSNPSNLSAQELLNQAIVNDSLEDIQEAIKMGANVNVGIGNQPPLLIAVIMGKERAAQRLLEMGANSNIRYLNEPLLFYFVKKLNYRFCQVLLKYGARLSDSEKKDIENHIMFRTPHPLNQDSIDILKMLGYEVKDNFKSSDLSSNKWYLLLSSNLGYLGTPRLDLVSLFITNGADPNQIFKSSDGLEWTPLLLVIQNYIKLKNKQCGLDSMNKLIKSLLDYGADINQSVICLPDKREASPLAYLLKYDDSNCVVDILMNNKANIQDAIRLYLNAGGEADKSFNFWDKSGSWNLLLLSVEHNNPEAVRLLIDAGAYKSPVALKLAITKGYGKIMDVLMQ